MYNMKQSCGEKGLVFAATDEMLFSCFELGADGAISAVLSVFPEITVKMWKMHKEGMHEEGLILQNKIYRVWKMIRGSCFTAKIKAVLKILGRDCGYSRSPICEADTEFIINIKNILKELEMIEFKED